MPDSALPSVSCPRCGSKIVRLCGESTQYAPEERADQPLSERKQVTRAYQCECGLAFTTTVRGDAE